MRKPGTAVRQPLNEEAGFTLPEMMVTVLIMTTVMFALYSIFDMSLRVFSFGNDKTEAVENARFGLQRMEREIRAAYPYNKPTDNTLFPGFSTNPSSSITFGNDLDGDRQILSDTSTEQIIYGQSGDQIQRNSQPLVEFAQPGGLSFTYCESVDACNPASPPSISEGQVKLVRIELTVEVDRGLSDAATQTLTTDVELRNRTG